MASYSNYDRIQNKPTPPNGMTQNKLYPPDDGGIQNQPYPPANAGAGGSGPGDAWADATGGGGGAQPPQQTYGFPNQRGTNLPWSYQADEPLPTWDGRRPPGIGSGAVPIQTGSPGQHGGSTGNWFDPATGKVTNQYGTITDTSFAGGSPEQWQMLASLAQGSPGGMLDPTQYQEAWRAGQGPSTEVVGTPATRALKQARWDTQRAATLARKGMAPNASPSAGVSRDPRTGRVLGERMMQLFQALLSQGQPGLAPGATGTLALDPNILRQLLTSLGTGG